MGYCLINNVQCTQELYDRGSIIRLYDEGYSMKSIKKTVTGWCNSKIKNPCSFVETVIFDYITGKS